MLNFPAGREVVGDDDDTEAEAGERREREGGGWVGGGGGTGELCWDPNAPAFVRASKEDISPPPLATQAVPVQEGTAGVSRNGGHSARQTVVLRDYGSPPPCLPRSHHTNG